tara:strand:+ start:46 stop:177 length:132 start_codon:yes stop_codon:yes gene_type:complete
LVSEKTTGLKTRNAANTNEALLRLVASINPRYAAKDKKKKKEK